MGMIYLDDAIEAIASRDETDGTCNVFSGKQVIDILKGLPSAEPEIIRCKDCKWFGEAGCAVMIVDDSDKPTEDDYCSFAELR